MTSVKIAPQEANLNIGDTQRFTFKAFDDAGLEVTAVLASWTVDPRIGKIDSQGLFTAGSKSGLHVGAIEVQVVSGTYRASHKAEVVIAPDPLTSIQISSNPAILLPGQGVQLTATGYDDIGNVISGLQFLWESTSGVKVDDTGFVTQAGTPSSEGLVGWWRGEGNARDSAGVNHGSVVNGTDYVPGAVGTAFRFDGVNQYVTVPPAPELNITGDVTVSLWADRSKFGGTRDRLIHKGGGLVNGVDVPTSYGLFFGNDEPPPPVESGNFVTMIFERDDGSNIYLISSNPSDSGFHHYVYVRNGSQHLLFLDGEIVANGTYSGTAGNTAGLPLFIGNLLGDDPYGLTFGGIIDEVRVYNRALLDSEVRNIFDSEKRSMRLRCGPSTRTVNGLP